MRGSEPMPDNRRPPIRRARVIDPVTQVELLVPEGISGERAIERARRERAGELRRIRFSLDRGHDSPLWEDGIGPTAPGDYGLSDELSVRLHSWVLFWEARCMPFEGWDSEQSEQEWLTTGDGLADLLEIEVYDSAVVLRQFRPRTSRQRG